MACTDDELDTCEACGEKAKINQMTSCADGCWMCPQCAAEAEAEFRSCDHQWTSTHDEYGDPAQFCERCSHIVLDESFPQVFGCPAPTSPATAHSPSDPAA